MAVLKFDDEAARRTERAYATPDVIAQRAEVLALLAPQPGERVLDIGSGPGFLAASIADAVGEHGLVRALDVSAPMNVLARARTATRPQIRVDEGAADALPYPDDAFDAAVSTQVYEYVAHMPRALVELRRVLRPGGRVLILDTDWESLVWHAADRGLHQRVVAAWEEHLVHPHLPCMLPGLLRQAGFEVTDRQVLTLFNPQLTDATFSASLMELVATFVGGRRGLTADDAARWSADLRARGAEDEYLFSLTRYVFLATAL